MKSYGIPPKIINIVKAFHDFKCAILDDNGDITQWFKIEAGVKQGRNKKLCPVSFSCWLLIS